MERAQRQTAFKVKIADVLNGDYTKEEGWLPNYISVRDMKVSRANIIAVVVAVVKEQSFHNILVDDGSGTLSLRLFEPNLAVPQLGDVVLAIGRTRDYGGERYLAPEILRKVDQRWLEIRQLEVKTSQVEETAVEEIVSENPAGSLLAIIRRKDDGSGAPFELISESVENCEDLINQLLALGEIFEVKPGRFKVLE
ncbi:MAG: hypothetical protein ACE5DM_02855 [Candidatus Nanoarchaeia archaeon]